MSEGSDALQWAEESGAFDIETPEDALKWARKVLNAEDPTPMRDIKFFGQESVIKQVTPFLEMDHFPHTLILGEPGIGKTHLARWIANKRSEAFEELLAPARPEDIAPTGVILLDEVHRQLHPEWLFPVMETATVTILGATTRPELMEPAFNSRFFLKLYLTRYTEGAMAEMARWLLPHADQASVDMYASASAGNPRQLEHITTVADQLGVDAIEDVLATCQITGDGLTELHIRILKTLRKGNRPMGINTLAVLLYIDGDTIKQHERLLIELDLVELRSNGRLITRQGKKYLTALEQTP